MNNLKVIRKEIEKSNKELNPKKKVSLDKIANAYAIFEFANDKYGRLVAGPNDFIGKYGMSKDSNNNLSVFDSTLTGVDLSDDNCQLIGYNEKNNPVYKVKMQNLLDIAFVSALDYQRRRKDRKVFNYGCKLMYSEKNAFDSVNLVDKYFENNIEKTSFEKEYYESHKSAALKRLDECKTADEKEIEDIVKQASNDYINCVKNYRAYEYDKSHQNELSTDPDYEKRSNENTFER